MILCTTSQARYSGTERKQLLQLQGGFPSLYGLGDFMSELITIEGIRMLLKQRLNGERLPDNWPDLIRDYIRIKEQMIENLGQDKMRAALIEEAKTTRRALYAY